jgi:hypothetical protein
MELFSKWWRYPRWRLVYFFQENRCFSHDYFMLLGWFDWLIFVAEQLKTTFGFFGPP